MALASLNLLFRTDITDFTRKLATAEKKFKRFGSQMRDVGKTMTRNVTLPLLAIAAASVKMASDLDASFTKIETLVGLSRDQVNGMREDVKGLSSDTGRSSKELADALFVVTSAGQRGSEALEILEGAAKAAAIGMGETRDIARLVTSAMNAYGKENLDAARATNVLIGIAREGNFEIEALAGSMGKVLANAAVLGVSFEELGANIASLTRLGVSAEEAVTALDSLMNSTIKTNRKGADALKSLGMTYGSLRKEIREKGLQSALTTLLTKLDGNMEAVTAIIPNVRALKAVLGTAGVQTESYAEIIKFLNGELNLTEEAFARVSQTASFKFIKALNKLKEIGIEIGNKLMPVAIELADRVSTLADKFLALSEAQIKTKIKVAVLVAALGPLLLVFGNIVTMLPVLARGIRAVNLAMASNPFVAVATVIATILGPALLILSRKLRKAREAQDELNTSVQTGIDIIKRSEEQFAGFTVRQLTDELTKLKGALEELGPADTQMREVMLKRMGVINDLIRKQEELKESTEDLGDETVKATGSLIEMNAALQVRDTAGIEARITVLKELIEVSEGLGYSADSLKKWRTELELLEGKETIKTPTVTGGEEPQKELAPISTAMVGRANEASMAYDNLSESVKKSGEVFIDFGQVAQTAVLAGMDSIGKGIEDLIAGTGDVGDIFSGLLNTIATFMQGLGKALIASALASEAFKELLLVNPAAAAAAGVALLVGASIVKGLLARGPEAPALAGGGLAFGPTLAMVGDNANARIDPEVIAPLSKLQGMGGGDVNVRGETRIGYDAIYIAWKKENDFRNRT